MIDEITQDHPKLGKSRLFCPINRIKLDISFSLVGYRNNYFTSNDPNKIIEFYNGFENRDQLIQWMRERPKGVANIREVEGDKDIIVVIPTADFNGKYAKECRENIFKGLHIVFVESGGKGDFYFNYAHNCNVGIRKAMEYNPKWVVVSNDDMKKNDDVDFLRMELSKLDHKNLKVIYAKRGIYHSVPRYLQKHNSLFALVVRSGMVGGNLKITNKLWNKFSIRKFKNFEFKKNSQLNNIIVRLFFPRIRNSDFINFGDFGIFGANYLKTLQGKIFDESFINAYEDFYLSIKSSTSPTDFRFINYHITDKIGSTLGTGISRHLQTIAGDVYFDSLSDIEFFLGVVNDKKSQ